MDLICSLRSRCQSNDESIRTCVNLSPVEYRAISILDADTIITASEFAHILELSLSRVSRVIDKMIAKGYISIEKTKHDKRVVVISLTDSGLAVKKSVEQESQICYNGIENALTEDERVMLSSLINKLIKADMHND